MKAVWNDTVIAESDDTVIVEGNHYFPMDAVSPDYLRRSDHTSQCPRKGEAHFYTLDVNGQMNENAAWCYPDPKPDAEHIRGRIAFWNGVQIER